MTVSLLRCQFLSVRNFCNLWSKYGWVGFGLVWFLIASDATMFFPWRESKQARKNTLILPLVWIMLLLHFQVRLSLYVIPDWGIPRIRGLPRLLRPFEGEHLEWAWTHLYLHQWQAPRFPHGWLKMSSSLCTLTLIVWIIGGRVH